MEHNKELKIPDQPKTCAPCGLTWVAGWLVTSPGWLVASPGSVWLSSGPVSLQDGRIFCRRTACDCGSPSADLFCCPECDTRVTSQCLDQSGHRLYHSGDNWTYSCQHCRCLVGAEPFGQQCQWCSVTFDLLSARAGMKCQMGFPGWTLLFINSYCITASQTFYKANKLKMAPSLSTRPFKHKPSN